MVDSLLSYRIVTSDMEEEATSSKSFKLTRTFSHSHPSGDIDIMGSIDAFYFIEEDFDAIDYELKKLSGFDRLCTDDVERERVRLKTQLQVVSRKIATLILEKADSYSSQKEDISGIRDDLSTIIEEVRTIRRYLKLCASKSTRSLSLLANDERKRELLQLRKYLLKIRHLHETEYDIEEMLEGGKFSKAIHLCMKAVKESANFSHLSCIMELREKLLGSSSQMEAMLDSALVFLVVHFDADKYLLIQSAYALLGKSEIAAEKLVHFICEAIDRRAGQVLEGHAGMTEEGLCQAVPAELLSSALHDLAFSLCQLLLNVHSMLRLHAEEAERLSLLSEGAFSVNPPSHLLSSSLYLIFRTALIRFNTLLCCHDFSSLQLDDILTIIEMTTRFRHFGRVYFGHCGAELSVSLEKQCAIFFSRQHAEKMDELRVFLLSEAFALCPLPPSFSLFDLQEFAFLRHGRTDVAEDSSEMGEQLPFTLLSPHASNPFATPETTEWKHREMASMRETPQWEEEENGQKSPVLCNSAIVVLRLLGRYLRMASLLHSVAQHAVVAITELFEFFFFSIVSFFSFDGSENASAMSRRLQAQFENSEQNLLSRLSSLQLCRPSLSPAVQLCMADSLFSLAERVVAIESLEFVSRQLELTRPVIESLIASNDNSIAHLNTFYSQMLSSVPDVRLSVISVVASRALKFDILLSAICSTKWQLSSIQSNHSTYVDFLLQDLEVFSLRLQRVSLTVPLSNSLLEVLWDRVLATAMRTVVQGYSQVGIRCSPEGRALMQLDLHQMGLRLSSLSLQPAAPHIAFVDSYIKAYYLPEKKLEEWVLSHSEYTPDQLLGLLNAATHVSKKTRTRIMSLLQI